MKYEDYREVFEDEANKEHKKLENLSLSELIGMIAKRNFGSYCQIWGILRDKATIKDIYEHFMVVLTGGKVDDLNRYNCAQAFIDMAQLESANIDAKDLAYVNGKIRKENIENFKNLVKVKFNIISDL